MTARQGLVGLAVLVVVLCGTLLLIDPGPDAPPEGAAVAGEGRDTPVDGLPAAPGAPDATATAEPTALTPAPTPAPEVPDDETTSDARSPTSGRVTGRLVSATGAPVADEPVDLLASRDAWMGARPRDAVHDVVDRTVSDADGRFSLGARAGAAHVLQAGGRSWPRRRVYPVAVGADLEVVLPEPRTITGSVVEQATGAPVPHARVGAHSRNDQLSTHADANGEFRLGPVHDELVVLTGFSPGLDVVITEPLAADWGPALLELPPGRELGGRVVDTRSGEPVPDARVTVRLITESRPAGEPDPLAGRTPVEDLVATTDDEGRYLLTGMPSRGFRVIVEADGYMTSTGDRYFTTSPDFDEDLVLGLVPADDLTGTVVVADDAAEDGKTPVAGARVTLLGDREVLAATTTDESGAFALATGACDLATRLEVVARDADGRHARRRLDTAALRTPQELELVEAFAVDVLVQGADGPCAGAHVLAVSDASPPTTSVTDDAGTARLVHPLAGPGSDTVWLQARHDGLQSLPAVIDPTAWPTDDAVVLDMQTGAFFEGVVVDGHGAPVAGATVAADATRFTTADRDGRFVLGPAALPGSGTVTVSAQATGFRTGTWEDTAPGTELVLELQPLVHWRGRATDAGTGLPVARVHPRLQAERPGPEGLAWEDVEADARRVGEPGTFEVELPDAGRYRLRVYSADHVPAESPAADFDGTHAPPVADLYLARAAVLEVKVEDPTGRAVPGYTVWVVPDELAAGRDVPSGLSGAGLRQQRTDEEGRTRFNLGEGLRLRLASGPGAWLDAGPVLVAPGAVVERRVVVPALGGMDLALLDEDGEPVAGLGIALESAGSSRVHSVRRAGTVEAALPLIEVRDLAAGEYTVTVEHDAYAPVERRVLVEGGRVAPVDAVLRAVDTAAADR